MKKMRVVGIVLAWAGMVAGLEMGAAQTAATAGKADSSAALRNDKSKDAAKRPMTFADLMAIKRVSDPQISPSGKWVMFSVTDVSLEKNTKVNHLWVVALSADGAQPTSQNRDMGHPLNTTSGPSTSAGAQNAPASAQDDKQKEKQVTSGEGETFGRFSPDGRWVSYTGAPTKDDPVSRITIATWDESTGMIGVGRTLTAVSGDADGAIWSPDSRHFLFTTQVYPECSVKGGGEAGKADSSASLRNDKRNVMTPTTWAEEDACNKAKDEAAEKSPVKAQVWDALFYRHWDQYTGLKRTHIIEADFSLDGANPRDLTPASAVGDAETPTWFLGAPLQYAWAPDSKEIAYVTNLDPVPAASTNNDVFTLRLDEPGAKAVKVSTSPGSDDAPAYSPDGKWLAFRSQKQAGFESDRIRLMLMDRGTKKSKELMPKFDRWVDEFAWGQEAVSPSPVWRIYFASGDSGTKSVFRVKTDGSELEQLTHAGEYSELQITPDGSRLVAGKMNIFEPTKLVLIDLEHIMYIVDGPRPSKIPKQFLPSDTDAAFHFVNEASLTHLNDQLISQLDLDRGEEYGEERAKRFWFAGASGMRVQGFIVRPPNFDATKKYPLKFVMHGGPQTALGDSWSYRWNWELLAADGYVVVGINRRGSTGYGQKFVDEVSGDWGGRAYEDLMKGLDYAEATYPFIDKTRECALGASYGGFMADWVLTHTNRFQCIVTHDGMFDPVSAYGTTEEMWFNEWEFRRPEDFPKGWDGFGASYNPMAGIKADSSAALRNDKQKSEVTQGGGHAAEPWRYQNLPANEDPFRKWSALRAIENAKTPTLIIHSQRDYRLDVSQGFELYTALERRGVPARFLYFPDEGHWVLKPQNSQLWYETVDDWCDRWTKSGKYAEK